MRLYQINLLTAKSAKNSSKQQSYNIDINNIAKLWGFFEIIAVKQDRYFKPSLFLTSCITFVLFVSSKYETWLGGETSKI